MNTEMGQITRQEVLARQRERYARAGKQHKTKIINELVALFGYHRKAAIRALQPRPHIEAPFVPGRPKTYDPDKLLPLLKAIRLHARQPCGLRLKGAPGDWLRACEQDHRRLDTDVRRALLEASCAMLDRLLVAVRVQYRGRATTRPGTLLRHQIPIRTDWDENDPGFLEVDTVAMRGIWKRAGGASSAAARAIRVSQPTLPPRCAPTKRHFEDDQGGRHLRQRPKEKSPRRSGLRKSPISTPCKNGSL
jgi:hypothetical protein